MYAVGRAVSFSVSLDYRFCGGRDGTMWICWYMVPRSKEEGAREGRSPVEGGRDSARKIRSWEQGIGP